MPRSRISELLARTEPQVAEPAPTPVEQSAPAEPDWVNLPEWIPLGEWAIERGWGTIFPVASGSALGSFGLIAQRGQLEVAPGSRSAFWNGTLIDLGFSPQWIGRKLLVHQLDLAKSLIPLMEGPGLRGEGARVIVVDAGHGGRNTGARSVIDGRLEKEFTLDWALRLRPLLAASGWTVHLTRTNDVGLSLSGRAELADRAEADLFISLHFNSAGSPERAGQSGVETYCLTPTGMPSSIVREFEDDWTQSYPNNDFDVQNFLLAVALHQSLIRATGRQDRGVRRARFMTVLQKNERPAVLIEGGFLSNPEEARLIAAPAYRQKLAEAVAAALKL